MKYVAAFRTYTWNLDVEELAARFFSALPNGVHVIFADNSHGKLEIPDKYTVVWHNDDASDLHLLTYPKGRTHWYNVDYALYELRRTYPEYEYYVTSESDLAINLILEPFLLKCFESDIAAVVHDLKPSTSDWHWHANADAAFDQPWRALCFFMAMSAAAVDALWEERRRLTLEFKQGQLSVWPFCETFIPSLLKEKGFQMAEIGAFAKTENLRFRPKLLINDPRANAPGSMAHSVLPQELFFKSTIAESPPSDWFRSESELRTTLNGYSLRRFADLLSQSFLAALDYAGYQAFRKEMSAAGIAHEDNPDLAFCKPSITSSTSAWSRSQARDIDAAYANGLNVQAGLAFHTAHENEPWWMVDMLEEYVVNEITIVNRVEQAERFQRFQILSSRDGTSWISRYSKIDSNAVSSRADNPYRIRIADPFLARHVKISLIGEGHLHLRRIQVFGWGLKIAPPVAVVH